jgi:negative regulator of sigma-B (phosphoserine phosphatase)
MEWATAGRPRPGEHASGDQSIAIGIDSGAALFAVLDGLGHGPDAAKAAMAAADAIENNREKRVEVLVQLCHRVLGGTRGAAMTLARVDFGAGQLCWTGVGNVSANVVAKTPGGIQVRSAARLAAGIVGYRIPEITPAQVVPIRTGDLIIIASDGIADDHLDHLDFATTAAVIADQILGKHAKETDDAMVLAARHRGGLK